MSPTASPLVNALLTSLDRHRLPLNGRRVWLACSGGRDSLSLAMLCRQLFDEGDLPFLPQLLHVNHGIQDANAAWSKQVMSWAKQVQMPCQVITLDLKDKSEQSARTARYEAMIKAMNCDDVLLLGHHQDDQVETVLMRLFKGAGVNGLSGMKEWSVKYSPVRHHKIDDSDDNNEPVNINRTLQKKVALWRPWLTVSRAQITDYAQSHNLAYIDDPTNVIADLNNYPDAAALPLSLTADNFSSRPSPDSFNTPLNDLDLTSSEINDRAWLRSVLLPHIIQRYPQFKQAIARSSQLIQAASRIVDEQVADDLKNVILSNPCLENPIRTGSSIYQKDTICGCTVYQPATDGALQSIIDINKLHKLSDARQSALIHAWLSPLDTEMPPSQRLVNDVLALSERRDSDHQTCLYWDSGQYRYQIRRYHHKLYRLNQQWLDWLDLPPKVQQLTFKFDTPYSHSDNVILKQSRYGIKWQLKGVHQLFDSLKRTKYDQDAKRRTDNNVSAETDTITLMVQPLPRDLKLTLAGRVGRKAGKKLLQELDQPSFQRQSVVVCSLKVKDCGNDAVPLFVITITGIVVLQSPFLPSIRQLVEQQQLMSLIIESNY